MSLFIPVYSEREEKRTKQERKIMSTENTDLCTEQKKLDEKYMREAIRQARKAYKLDETPIGWGIGHDGQIIVS